MSDLLNEAAAATPSKEQRGQKASYGAAWPIYSKLRGQGFSPMAAVDWLISKGEIAAVNRIRAYHALINRERRQ